VNDSYEELVHVFDRLPKYYMNILLRDFNAKVGRGDIFKPTLGNESLHEISNGNGIPSILFPFHYLLITLSFHAYVMLALASVSNKTSKKYIISGGIQFLYLKHVWIYIDDVKPIINFSCHI
jgi:hypothetical protein